MLIQRWFRKTALQKHLALVFCPKMLWAAEAREPRGNRSLPAEAQLWLMRWPTANAELQCRLTCFRSVQETPSFESLRYLSHRCSIAPSSFLSLQICFHWWRTPNVLINAKTASGWHWWQFFFYVQHNIEIYAKNTVYFMLISEKTLTFFQRKRHVFRISILIFF